MISGAPWALGCGVRGSRRDTPDAREQHECSSSRTPVERRRSGRGCGFRWRRSGPPELRGNRFCVELAERVLGRVLGAAHLGHHRSAARGTRPQATCHATTTHRRRSGPARRLRTRDPTTQPRHDPRPGRDGSGPSRERARPLPLTKPVGDEDQAHGLGRAAVAFLNTRVPESHRRGITAAMSPLGQSRSHGRFRPNAGLWRRSWSAPRSSLAIRFAAAVVAEWCGPSGSPLRARCTPDVRRGP